MSKQYALAIQRYSERNKEAFVYPGSNYRQLAQFLNPFPPQPAFKASHKFKAFSYVILHTFGSGTEKNIEHFDALEGTEAFSRICVPKSDTSQLLTLKRDQTNIGERRTNKPEHGRLEALLFLRGYPSPEWLNLLGASYRLDPEYLRRHLLFSQYKDCFDIPALPACSRNILQLRITTICTRQVPLTRQILRQCRREEMGLVRKHQRQLGSDYNVGQSIVRRYSVLSETRFTLEQIASCCVQKRNGAWTGKVSY